MKTFFFIDGLAVMCVCGRAGRQGMEARQSAQVANFDSSYVASGRVVSMDDNKAEASKRRRGRPPGSKDRQPRVKRMTTSPQPSEQGGDKGAAASECEGRRKRWKIILTAEQAVEIYKKRTIGNNFQSTSSCRSNEVAEQYGVNSKTIRDIWNRATWVKATRPSWTDHEEEEYVQNQLFSSARAAGTTSTSNDTETTRSSESEV